MQNFNLNLYDLSHTLARDLLLSCEYPWQALPLIKEFVTDIIEKLSSDNGYFFYSDSVLVAKSTVISKGATLIGPAVIGKDTEIRTGAFIRGSVMIGEECVIGNSCEIKNSILFDNAQVPHFNYIGDSILGYGAHTGAGVITSNLKNDKSKITVHYNGEQIETDLKKFGALIGDGAQIGCNSVLNPGAIIGKNTSIYPLSSVRGVVPENSIYKSQHCIIQKYN